MSDLEKLLSDCNNLKMLRNQVSMDGREIKRRNEIIDGWHIEKTWIKAYNEFRALEQQLSNSISKDELRGLVDELRAIENRDNNPRDQHLVGASLGAGMAANKLNKLIEGDNNG